VNVGRLATFLAALPRTRRHTIEFREPSWYCDEVFALLERYHVALCLHDMRGSASGRVAIGPFVYVRFHGTEKYTGSYSDRTLQEWADWLAERHAEGRPIYAYFNNDSGGHAPRDAVRLRKAVQGRVGQVGLVGRTDHIGQASLAGRAGQAGLAGRAGQAGRIGRASRAVRSGGASRTDRAIQIDDVDQATNLAGRRR
jgi:hypothetical protein